MPKILKIGLTVAIGYVSLVVAFACFVIYQGKSHAERGVAADEEWIVLTTLNADGNEIDSVLAGVEIDEKLYVATNHWPRSWYYRAVDNPLVLVEVNGRRAAFRAVPLTPAEHDYIAHEYSMPLIFRILTGFPPRRFLMLKERDA